MPLTTLIRLPAIAIISLSLAGCASSSLPPQQQPQPAQVTELMRQPLPDSDTKEVRILTVEYPPGGRSATHRHPGAVFAYVLEGAVLCQVEGQPLRTYHQGDVWYEYPRQLHAVSANASATAPAKILVFFLTEKGQPALVPEK